MCKRTPFLSLYFFCTILPGTPTTVEYSGTSSTTYSGNATVTASQYLTFVLRALDYDSSTDFQWDKAWELSDKLGITDDINRQPYRQPWWQRRTHICPNSLRFLILKLIVMNQDKCQNTQWKCNTIICRGRS